MNEIQFLSSIIYFFSALQLMLLCLALEQHTHLFLMLTNRISDLYSNYMDLFLQFKLEHHDSELSMVISICVISGWKICFRTI